MGFPERVPGKTNSDCSHIWDMDPVTSTQEDSGSISSRLLVLGMDYDDP